MEPAEDLIAKAKEYAISCHTATNHYYDEHPYSFHLQMVAEVAEKYAALYFEDAEIPLVIAAAWCHDIIEDARESYNDVKKVLGEQVADIVFLLTTEKGKTRRQRAGKKYYKGIRSSKYATFVKICDRFANTQYSGSRKSRMFEVYGKEFKKFKKSLKQENDFLELWAALKDISLKK